MKDTMKFEPTRISGVSRSLTGSTRGMYFCTAVEPPKKISGHPGQPKFDETVRSLVGAIKYSDDETDEKKALGGWIFFALRKARARAKERRLPFDMELSDLHAIMERQNHKCALTGASFDLDIPEDKTRRPLAPSLDRIDTSQGYVTSNVRITTVIANLARQDFGDDAFFKMCTDAAINKGLVCISRSVASTY